MSKCDTRVHLLCTAGLSPQPSNEPVLAYRHQSYPLHHRDRCSRKAYFDPAEDVSVPQRWAGPAGSRVSASECAGPAVLSLSITMMPLLSPLELTVQSEGHPSTRERGHRRCVCVTALQAEREGRAFKLWTGLFNVVALKVFAKVHGESSCLPCCCSRTGLGSRRGRRIRQTVVWVCCCTPSSALP